MTPEQRAARARIPLSCGGVVLVDPADYPALSRRRWYRDSQGYAQSTSRPRVRMHRALLPGTAAIDHINGDKLDNRRSNLRPATHSQNAHAAGTVGRVIGQSGYRGVWKTESGRWSAILCIQRTRLYLGRFDSADAAAQAWQAAALAHFGEYARVDGLKQPDRAVSAGKTTDAPPAALSAAGSGLWGSK